MCCHLAAKDSYRMIGPTEEAVLTLLMLVHPCANVLLAYVFMCAKGGHPLCEDQDLHEQHP